MVEKILGAAMLAAAAGAAIWLAQKNKNQEPPDVIESTATPIDGVGPLFEDNFDGDVIDPAKWEKCPCQLRQGVVDVWDDDMAYLDGEGHLILRAEWDAENHRVRSGAIRTKGLFEHGYGYYEACIRLPQAYGIWGAFWMMCGAVGNVDGSSADGVEIDVIESIHSESDKANHALHWDGYGEAHRSQVYDLPSLNIYDGEFHRFGLERTPEAYIFYVDGAETWRTEAAGCCPMDGYMKLSVEAAEWAGAGSERAIASLPAEMVVEWVRVWEKKPE
ncbi:MAG: glycoside hydrolase family 16 protein [Clostridia bacterium]|nr:glycoside hydrolase family 16 protein [Clostridia bacterium]